MQAIAPLKMPEMVSAVSGVGVVSTDGIMSVGAHSQQIGADQHDDVGQ